MHLLGRQQHTSCTERECVRDCGFRAFHEWLDKPLMPWQVRERERKQARILSLLSGDLPA